MCGPATQAIAPATPRKPAVARALVKSTTSTSMTPVPDAAFDLARAALEDAALPQQLCSAQRVLALVPRHVLQHVFVAYCSWLVGPCSPAGQQFKVLLQAAPHLDLYIFYHAAATMPSVASSWQDWYNIVMLAKQDSALSDKLVKTFVASLPCSARRILHF